VNILPVVESFGVMFTEVCKNSTGIYGVNQINDKKSQIEIKGNWIL